MTQDEKKEAMQLVGDLKREDMRHPVKVYEQNHYLSAAWHIEKLLKEVERLEKIVLFR